MLGKNKSTRIKPTFNERLHSVKSMFKEAYENASKLNCEMQDDIDEKVSQIQILNSEISEIQVTKDETTLFMSNLEKFI